jgi:hypothetical protein
MTSHDRLPTKGERERRIILCTEAYKQVFEERILRGDRLTLVQAKLLLNKFNNDQRAGGDIRATLGGVFFAAIQSPDSNLEVVSAVGSLRLQEIDLLVHRVADPNERKVLENERDAIKKAIDTFSGK